MKLLHISYLLKLPADGIDHVISAANAARTAYIIHGDSTILLNYEDGWELFHTLDVSFSGGIFLSLWKNQPFNILTWNFLQLLDKGLFSVWYILDFWIRPPEMRKSKI